MILGSAACQFGTRLRPRPSPIPVPMAVIMVRISLFCSTLSSRAFSTLMILPRIGKMPGTSGRAPVGRATGRVALDDVKLGVFGIAIRTVRELARQTAASQRGFAHGFRAPCAPPRGHGRRSNLVDDALGDRRVAIENDIRPSKYKPTDCDAPHLRREQLHLGLRLKLWIAVLYRDHRRQAFAHIITGDLRVFLLQQLVGLRVLIDRPGQRARKPDKCVPPSGLWIVLV